MDMGLPVVALVPLFALCVLVVWWREQGNRRLPPGPPRLPIIGNLHQISDDYQQDTFTEWARKYGDVVYARFFTRDVLIINSTEAARVLMEKRGAKYSGRPLCTYICDLGGFEWNVGFITYTDRWRRHRRWFQHGFQVRKRLDSYIPIQQRECRTLLADLLREPDAVMSHFKRFAAAVMLEIGYGHTVTSVDDAHIHKVDTAVEGLFLAGNPGSMLVDFFPVLKHVPVWFPGAGWKRTAVRLRPAIDAMNLDPFREVLKAVRADCAKPSFATAILEESQLDGALSPGEEREMSGAVGVVYSAGTETTVSVFATWLLAMVRHPEIYKRLQMEMENVVGRARLPQFEDRQSLPYLECVLKEAYRFGPPLPLSVAHQLTEEDNYNGYYMPPGATVIPNIWAMTRDETIYKDPDEFKPERFLDISLELSELRDPRRYVFGHGRRICPGRFLGDSSAWLVIASVIATFDVSKARNSAGQEITPPADFLSGFIRHPKHFVCSIKPRSEQAATLILDGGSQ